MIRWAEVPRFSPEDMLLATSEAVAIGRCLSERGLENCWPPLHRDTPVSVHQQLSMLRAASGLASDPFIAVSVGLGLHPTSYGIAGLALLSSASLRHALQIVVEYGALLCLKVQVSLELSGGEARLALNNCFGLTPGLLQLCSQLEVAKLCTLLRDLSGCRVSRIELASPPELRRQLEVLLGAPVQCGTDTSYVSFDSALLDAPLPQADATTHQRCLRSCDELISSLRRCHEIRRRVRGMVRSANGTVPTLSQVASRLFVSTRTLRRRLEDAQTSYQEIVAETRRDLAVRYLTQTSLSTEAIAEILGYSDTANFRQAFKRWTGESPQQYRRRARSPESAGPPKEVRHMQRETNESRRCTQGSVANVVDLRVGTAAPLLYRAGEFCRLMPQGESS
jgi:AraC-like DNA-binding protein